MYLLVNVARKIINPLTVSNHPCYTMLHHMLHHATPCYTMLHHMLHHATPHATPCYVHHVTPCYTMLHHMLHHATPCYTMPHYATPCYTMPHHAGMLYFIIKYYVDRYNIYYVYKPAPFQGRQFIHRSAVNFVIVGAVHLQLFTLFFSIVRLGTMTFDLSCHLCPYFDLYLYSPLTSQVV